MIVKEIYEEAFKYYQSGNFERAKSLFRMLKHDKPSLMMLERIEKWEEENVVEVVLEEWKGIWNWKEK